MANPTSLAGYMDDSALSPDGYAQVVDLLLENIPALQHPTSVLTYAAMRHEPQLAAILRTYMLALERAHWSINGAGCRDEVVAKAADDFGLPIKGYEAPSEDDPRPETPLDVAMRPTGARRRKFTWSKHLPVAARLSLTYGHAPFAQQWDVQDGRYRLGMVQERMPTTISTLRLNRDGTLRAVQQGGLANGGAYADKIADLTTGNHELVWYAREREGSNYFGHSLLRASYAAWLTKTELARVHATSIRRFGMGVWTVEAPNGTPQEMAQAERLAGNYQAGQRAGAGLPPGFVAKLTGMTGNVPDAVEFITYLDRQMTRSTLTSILDMATAERGSRSLGETIMQLMVYAQQAEAQRIADDATEQLMIPLIDANWGEDEPAPVIEVGDVGADVQLTAQDMNWLLQYGGLHGDDVLEEHTRQRYGLPPIDHATRQLSDTGTTTNTGGAADA